MGEADRYMTEKEAKQGILDIGRRMYEKGFVAANDGNISCRVSSNEIWCTPTGVSKGFMTEDFLVKMDLDGNVLEGHLKPSSEIKMHLRVYHENKDLMAVTHAHPPVSTSFSIAGISLDSAILTEGVMLLGTIPVARYATPGSMEVPDSIASFVNTHNGVMLSNHGVLTWGSDLYQAFYRLESVENYATVTMYTKNIIGKQRMLSESQVEALIAASKKMGLCGGGTPSCAKAAQNTEDVLNNKASGNEFTESEERMIDEIVKRVVAQLR